MPCDYVQRVCPTSVGGICQRSLGSVESSSLGSDRISTRSSSTINFRLKCFACGLNVMENVARHESTPCNSAEFGSSDSGYPLRQVSTIFGNLLTRSSGILPDTTLTKPDSIPPSNRTSPGSSPVIQPTRLSPRQLWTDEPVPTSSRARF